MLSFRHFIRNSALTCALILPIALPACALETPRRVQNESENHYDDNNDHRNADLGEPERVNTAQSLMRFQLALDQISGGRLVEARVLLEDAVRRDTDSAETDLLLAYLLEHEGRISDARTVLQRVSTRSPLAATYLARLKNQPDAPQAPRAFPNSAPEIIAPAQAPTKSNTNNPARSPLADQRLGKLEQQLARLVNEARADNGLSDLQYSDELAEVARAHSVEMRDKKYFAHESPTPNLRRPMDRYIAALNRTPRIVAENIYRAWGTQHQLGSADIEAAMKSFMNSPSHRTNILLSSVTKIGIGLAVDDTGNIWVTQMFEKPL